MSKKRLSIDQVTRDGAFDKLDHARKQGRYFDEVGAIIAFEQGELDDQGVIELFQHLVNNGHAWVLQGSYGRTAEALIKAGLVNGG